MTRIHWSNRLLETLISLFFYGFSSFSSGFSSLTSLLLRNSTLHFQLRYLIHNFEFTRLCFPQFNVLQRSYVSLLLAPLPHSVLVTCRWFLPQFHGAVVLSLLNLVLLWELIPIPMLFPLRIMLMKFRKLKENRFWILHLRWRKPSLPDKLGLSLVMLWG